MSSNSATKNTNIKVRIRNDKVTGSSLEISVISRGVRNNFVIDKGLFMEEDTQTKNFTDKDCSNIDGVFLTHAHIDHCGQIPYLYKLGYKGPVYMSKETSQISQELIRDEFYVLNQNGIKITEEDEHALRAMGNQTKTVKSYDNVNFESAMFTFIENPHVLGANMIYMTTKKAYKNLKILISGDYRPVHPFIKTRGIKHFIKKHKVDVLFLEATYGGRPNHLPFDQAMEEFKNAVLEIINGNGDVLVPVFSFDRTQVILYALKQLQCAYPEMMDIPIFLDGKLAQRITQIYMQESVMKDGSSPQDILPKNLSYIVGKQERDAVYNIKRKIILATSGQMHSGAIVPHIIKMIQNPNDGIIAVGYVGHKAGRSILDALEGDVISYAGKELRVNCKRYSISGFSAHADMEQLADLVSSVKAINPDLNVVLYHGDPEAKEALREYLHEHYIIMRNHVYIPKSDDIVKINKYTIATGDLILALVKE